MQKIKVKQIRSVIDRPLRNKRSAEARGLGRPKWVKTHNDTHQIRGMVNKISHLAEVSEHVSTGEEKDKPAAKRKRSVKKTSATEKTKKSPKAKKEIKS